MAIIYHDSWEMSEKGKKDAERHQRKVDDAIRKNVRDVIGEESIITKKGKKKIKIPIRGLKDYRFIYGDNEENGIGAGVGQGEGQPGDVIGKREKKSGDGKPGENEVGDDIIEAEVDIDYLLKIMFQDLGLPWIDEKTKTHQLVPKGWKFETISKKGIIPRIHKKKTMIEAVKRNVMYAAEIMNETECSEEDAYKSLNQSNGDINEAISIIKEGRLNGNEKTIIIEDEDLRFKQIERDVEYHSNAVVLAMMDVSGSMGRDKKYLCRSLLFWLVEFLKTCYDNVQIRFIQHTTEAKLVDEDTFFHKGESGGTKCSTAFELANYLIDTEYPVNEWNVYSVYVGDGEDWDTKTTINRMDEMIKKQINMLAYIEVDPDENDYGGSFRTLLNEIKTRWKFTTHRNTGTDFYRNDKRKLLMAVLKDKTHIWPCLQHILFQKRKDK